MAGQAAEQPAEAAIAGGVNGTDLLAAQSQFPGPFIDGPDQPTDTSGKPAVLPGNLSPVTVFDRMIDRHLQHLITVFPPRSLRKVIAAFTKMAKVLDKLVKLQLEVGKSRVRCQLVVLHLSQRGLPLWRQLQVQELEPVEMSRWVVVVETLQIAGHVKIDEVDVHSFELKPQEHVE